MTDIAERELMLTRSKVATLAKVSERRLDYWENTGLLSTTVNRNLTGNRRVRLLNFTDAMTALVLAELRERVSLQHVRQIVDHLQQLEYRVTEVKFALAGNRVLFQLPDGSWGEVRDPGQVVLHQVLDLEPLRAALLGAGRRPEASVGHIERRRGSLGSKPVLAGTRIPVRAVQAYLANGSSVAEILEAYPSLTSEDVDAVRHLQTA